MPFSGGKAQQIEHEHDDEHEHDSPTSESGVNEPGRETVRIQQWNSHGSGVSSSFERSAKGSSLVTGNCPFSHCYRSRGPKYDAK
jgi:hypothetical protein